MDSEPLIEALEGNAKVNRFAKLALELSPNPVRELVSGDELLPSSSSYSGSEHAPSLWRLGGLRFKRWGKGGSPSSPEG